MAVRARQFTSTMPIWEARLEVKKSPHLPKPALFTSTLISGSFSFSSFSKISRLSCWERSREMAAMVLSGCSSAISFNSSLRRATSQKTSTVGYSAMMALIYSFPSRWRPGDHGGYQKTSPFLLDLLLPFIVRFSGRAVNAGFWEKVYNFFRFSAVAPGTIMV